MDFQLDPAQLGFEFQTGRLQNLFVRMSKRPTEHEDSLVQQIFQAADIARRSKFGFILFHIVFFSSMQQFTTQMQRSLEVCSIIETKSRMIKQAIEMYY